jgi:hypothetical protein
LLGRAGKDAKTRVPSLLRLGTQHDEEPSGVGRGGQSGNWPAVASGGRQRRRFIQHLRFEQGELVRVDSGSYGQKD